MSEWLQDEQLHDILAEHAQQSIDVDAAWSQVHQQIADASSFSSGRSVFPHLRAPRRLLAMAAVACVVLSMIALVFGARVLGGGHTTPTVAHLPTASAHIGAEAMLKKLLANSSSPTIQQLADSSAFSVNQSKSVDGNTVTIQQVLADANNIVLSYTIDGNTPVWSAKGGSFGPEVLLPGGQTLHGVGSIASNTVSPLPFVPTLYPPIAGYAQFWLAPPQVSSTAIAGLSHQITLVFTIPAAEHATTQFTVTVPFYAVKTVTINQSATSNGQQLTLDEVVIGPSGVRFFYSTGHTFLHLGRWRLTVDGKTYYGGGGYGGGYLTGGESYADIDDNLVADPGVWTVQTGMPGVVGQGSWSFTFSVP